ncbi:MAG TPA: SRPBCC family protein [Acidimicrobiales bacterium]|nr:SRPBCC family protein [Acidimicrobiales bacterium]
MKNIGTLKVEPRGDREIVVTRVFDAPRDLVWKAMTQPELVKRWFGPHGHQLIECEIDFRPGGRWRYLILMPNGQTMGMRGEYLEIEPLERIVHTESFDEYADFGTGVNTSLFTEEDGRTTFTGVQVAPSREVRDAILESGMEHGAAETYDRLAELLAVL